MLIVISPAKTLDFETPSTLKTFTQPQFLEHAGTLVEVLRAKAPHELSALMHISDKLGALNWERFQQWSAPFSPVNAKHALLAFRGDVYSGLDADSFRARDVEFAQKHLRILSGLYGVLRPLDLMQPYRLEMGTPLRTGRGRNLYEFWGEHITDALNAELRAMKRPLLVNLASEEYFKAVRPKHLVGPLLTVQFKERKGGEFRIVSVHAKKARGLMSAFIVKHRIDRADGLRNFDAEGYVCNPELSQDGTLVFTRDAP